jgi:hypothetical protein
MSLGCGVSRGDDERSRLGDEAEIARKRRERGEREE